MMLDAKRTFDALIERLAPDDRTRDEVLANRIYQQLSSAVAGSQEFTAIAKLYELDQEGDFDLLVLDTPPSRNALDFLDAPDRLTGFFGGRAIRMFLRPAGLGGKVLGRGHRRRLLAAAARHRRRPAPGPVGLLPHARRDDRRLHRARRPRRRAARGPGDDVPDRHLARATTRSRRRSTSTASCATRRCRSAALVVNRVRAAPSSRRRRCRPSSPTSSATSLAARVGESARELAALAARDAARRRAPASPSSGDPPAIVVPELDDDVHDVDGLARVREHLFGRRAPERARLVRGSVSAGSRLLGRAARRRRGAAPASRWPQSTSRSIARRFAPSSAIRSSTSGSGRTRPGDRGALERDRVARGAARRAARSSGVAQIAAIRAAMPS